MLSNPTYFDSTASYEDYIKKAKDLGMNAIAFTEHGNVFQWLLKKKKCEENEIKYIHASEFYMAIDLNIRERQDYHICLYAKNYEGVKELNRLSSLSYEGKGEKWYEGIHYYYRPRISLQELMETSENIIISTACLASLLWRKRNKKECYDFLEWMSKNRHRCFLEVQPHNIEDQTAYNELLKEWSSRYKIPLIAGTDTHVLNKEDMELRHILQKGKKATGEEQEDGIILHLRNYEELVEEFLQQGVFNQEEIKKIIDNTNVLADKCEDWNLDLSHKYPKISEKPEVELWNRIEKGMKKRGVYSYPEPKKTQYLDRIREEYETYSKLNMCDYILLLDDIKEFCFENKISIAPRGSCNGAQSLWALGVTDIDSIKFKLHFFRFVNPHRVSLGDVDIDMAGSKRPLVKDFLYNYKGINGSAILTYQTLALRGACRLVAKGLGYPIEIENMVAKDIEEVKIEDENGNEKTISTFNNKEKWEKEYPKWMELTFKAVGIIENSSTHACGFVATDKNIFEEIGTFENGDSPWRISQNNMKAIDSVNFVKMDFLVVDNVQIIEDTCRLAGIDPLNNDELDLEDNNVWSEMLKSGLGIFQFEKSGWYSLKEALENYPNFTKSNPNITRYDIMLALNGVIRPACESFRKEFLQGKPHENGHDAINDFLSDTMQYCIFQEQIMKFLEKFCDYSGAESDSVRRGISKKGGTDKFVPKIRKRFVEYFSKNFNTTHEKAEELIEDFIVIILNAKDYGFSTNHSCPYTLLGYKGAFLRHYYPLEYLTTQLDINEGKIEKTSNIIDFIKKFTNIKIKPARFRKSTDRYLPDKKENSIYKGMSSIKNLSSQASKELYELRDNEYKNFFYLLKDIREKTCSDATKIDVLIKIDFFEEFGKPKFLLECVKYFDLFKRGNAKQVDKEKAENLGIPIEIIKRHSKETPKQYRELNTWGILNEIYEWLQCVEIKDFSIIEKIQFQQEYLGYINFKTDQEKDRRKLIVLSIRKLISKKNGNVWGYSCKTMSLGSGKTAEITIGSYNYNKQPIDKYSTIYASKLEKKRGYWWCTSYNLLNGEAIC